MSWDEAAFQRELDAALEQMDFPAVRRHCDALIGHLAQVADPYPAAAAEKVLKALRRKRQFECLRRTGDAFIQSGAASPGIRRLYAQALIDGGDLTAALSVLNDLKTSTRSDPGEHAEACGLIGRVHKQVYVNAGQTRNPRLHDSLRRAVAAYFDVYRAAPADHAWHGINVVALVMRAHRDGEPATGLPDPLRIAGAILGEIERRHRNAKADTWDFATAVEACVALDRADDALVWLSRYLAAPYTDAFELGSTHRQLTEVWHLDEQSDVGRRILPPLRARLLQQEGGQVDLAPADLQAERQPPSGVHYEKVLGPDSYQSYKWYQTGAQRCLIVARIGRDPALGHGTGFLVKGSDLSPAYGDDPVVITNAHVVSDDPAVRKKHDSLDPFEVVVSFEALGTPDVRVEKVLWTSPPEALDATVLRLEPSDALRVAIQGKLARIAKALPAVEDSTRVYIIGHPRGGGLSLSLQDNRLLDHENPWVHYRTPTEGGSSGSPVFNRQWDLIGLHHAGGDALRRLNGKDGTYPANEGIWLGAIIQAIGQG